LGRYYFDVSSTVDTKTNPMILTILELTNGSKSVTLKYRDIDNDQWLVNLETTFDLFYEYTGASGSIAIMSDSHYGIWSTPELYKPNFIEAIDFIDDVVGDVTDVFVLGDVLSDNLPGTYYPEYKTDRATSDIPDSNWHEIAGNHDVLSGADGFLASLRGDESAKPYYTVEIGNCVFIMISDETGKSGIESISSTTNDWIDTTLSENQDKNCFLMTHEARKGTVRNSTYVGSNSNGWLTGITAPDNKKGWVAWFCGHMHGYQHYTDQEDGRVYYGTPTD
jgi:hypothetical protein